MKYSEKKTAECYRVARVWLNISPATIHVYLNDSEKRQAHGVIAEYIANHFGYTIYETCATEVEKE